MKHRTPSVKTIPRPLSTWEQQDQERWHGSNLAQIMKIDAYIAERTKAGGCTVFSQFAQEDKQ